MTNFSLKRGLDIPILGSPEQKIYKGQKINTLAVIGTDFVGLKPQMLISEGEKVQRGTPLFCHKDYPEVIYVSPCKGHVQSINRGERRVLRDGVARLVRLVLNEAAALKGHCGPA